MNSENPNKYLDIAQHPSEDLAAYIVVYRTLGIDKKLALICMSELARRREMGEDFNFEDFIEEEIKKIPKLPDVDLVRTASSINGNIKEQAKTFLGNK